MRFIEIIFDLTHIPFAAADARVRGVITYTSGAFINPCDVTSRQSSLLDRGEGGMGREVDGGDEEKGRGEWGNGMGLLSVGC